MNKTVTSLALATAVIGGVAIYQNLPSDAQPVTPIVTVNTNANVELSGNSGQFKSDACDDTLWQHVYAGDPRRFKKPQDRLKVIQDCITVTGTLFSSKPEKDGDLHIRLTVDPQYQNLLNAKNMSAQKGKLVIEPVCQKTPTQPDTLDEKACDGFDQKLDIPPVGTRVAVTGAYITDMEHGWNELHPVTSIAQIR